jgi:uncharacterized damage-inducible protein DinB
MRLSRQRCKRFVSMAPPSNETPMRSPHTLSGSELQDTILAAWRTNSRVTSYLLEQIPATLWSATVPLVPSRTVRAIAAHVHNARCRWIKTLGGEHGIVAPRRVDQRAVTRQQLLPALTRSGRGIAALLQLGCESGGRIPPSRGYTWRNLSLDVGHVLTYFVAHEAHHRGQLVMAARQLDERLSNAVMAGLWRWRPRRSEEES